MTREQVRASMGEPSQSNAVLDGDEVDHWFFDSSNKQLPLGSDMSDDTAWLASVFYTENVADYLRWYVPDSDTKEAEDRVTLPCAEDREL